MFRADFQASTLSADLGTALQERFFADIEIAVDQGPRHYVHSIILRTPSPVPHVTAHMSCPLRICPLPFLFPVDRCEECGLRMADRVFVGRWWW